MSTVDGSLTPSACSDWLLSMQLRPTFSGDGTVLGTCVAGAPGAATAAGPAAMPLDPATPPAATPPPGSAPVTAPGAAAPPGVTAAPGAAAGAPSPFDTAPEAVVACADWSTVVPQPARSSTAPSTTNRRRRVTPGFFHRLARSGLSVPLAPAPAIRANPPTATPRAGPLCAP